MDLETFQKHELHLAWGDLHEAGFKVNGRSNSEILGSLDTEGDRQYHPCPESFRREEVTSGIVKSFKDWSESSVFKGTRRNISVYLPNMVSRPVDEMRLIVCNDGPGYRSRNGAIRATQVLDNLIHDQEIPPTAAVFITPGLPEGIDNPEEGKRPDEKAMRQRSIEYDTCNGDYLSFLVDEALPFVEKETGQSFSRDPSHKIVCGISSGGICAFNAAWHGPEQFGCVISHCGSFTNIRGGHNYPYLIRSTPRKPIKVFLQSGERDADIVTGSWALANKDVAAALDFAGYDFRFEFGSGGHNLRHGGSLFADTLRWLIG